MKKTVLLTRPQASSERWAKLLGRHGFDCIVEPLLTIEPTHAPLPSGSFQAVLITSANAPDMLEALKEQVRDLFALPCFCVGLTTSAAAEAVGFKDVHSGFSDSAELAHKIVKETKDKTKPLLHISGDTVDDKAQRILNDHDFILTPWPVYKASAKEDFTLETCGHFKSGVIDAIPVFSPRSARILVSIIEKNHLSRACHNIVAVGLSHAVADVLQTLPWRRLRVANMPGEDAVLSCLQAELSMTPKEKTSSSFLAPKSERRKSGQFLTLLLALTLFVALGAGAFSYTRLYHVGNNAEFIKPQAGETKELQEKIDRLETRLNAMAETPVLPSAKSIDQSDVNDKINSLQNQVAELEKRSDYTQHTTQKFVAASFAFLDLREAAMEGQPFSSQLEALRKIEGDEATVNQQLSILELYANKTTPGLAPLREELKADETSDHRLGESSSDDWKGRLKEAWAHLVFVHPLKDQNFSALEEALERKDTSAALLAFKTLPLETEKNLASFGQELEARAAIDSALEVLTKYFATLPTQSDEP